MQLNHIHFHPIKLVRFSLLKTATSILLTCKEVGIDPNAVLGSYYRVSFLLLQPFFPRKASAFRAPSGDRQAKRGWGGEFGWFIVCLPFFGSCCPRSSKEASFDVGGQQRKLPSLIMFPFCESVWVEAIEASWTTANNCPAYLWWR